VRVHRLELTAFGPFPATESIDFDTLNDAGVFLLTGHTGAGKTSILDAICFGLFGSVPGDRNNAKDLRSHHAGPSAVPAVELEVTIRGRRFRLRRSPAWSKPSRRAKSGFVEQHAQARVSELVDGEWQPLSGRVDEVGHLVGRVLGMTRDQFCQVVMLPQGQFQTFLKAGAKDRHDVLEALFETGRFLRIEKWLTEHRKACEREFTDHEASLHRLVARLDEATDRSLIGLVDSHDVGGTVGWRTYAAAVEAVRGSTDIGLVEARTLEAATRARAKAAEHAYDEARSLADRQERHAEAVRQLTELDANADVVRDRLDVVDRAKAAEAIFPLAERLREAATRRDDAVERITIAIGRAANRGRDLAGLDLKSLEELIAALRIEHSDLKRLRGLDDEVAALDREVAILESSLTSNRTAMSDIQRQMTEAPVVLTAARRELQEVERLAGGAEDALKRLERAQSVMTDAADAAELEGDLAALTARVVAAQRDALDAREVWLGVRERHLESLSAILAGDLVDGDACPVCGSQDHPSPAQLTEDHVSAEAEAEALEALTRADELLGCLRDEFDRCSARHATLVRRSGGLSPAEAELVVDDARAAAGAAHDANADLTRLDSLVTQLTDRLEELGSEQAMLTAGIAADIARLAERSVQAEAGRARLVAAVGLDSSVQQQIDLASAALAGVGAAAAAMRDAEERSRLVDERQDQLDAALSASPFGSAAEAMAARMTKPDLANAESLNRAAADQRSAALHTLAQHELAEAAARPAPAVEELKTAYDVALDEGREVSARAARLSERSDRLDALGAEFAAGVAALEPLQAKRDLAGRVAAMCSGTSLDNQTRTRLSHFVLSARLQQVVEAANVRLRSISAGRYQLQHSMRRGVGDARGGLGLLVLDTYTGLTRDPATLSGGETFYVSLALALGLADLVRDEIGGVELSTLFVDEGFGSLDSETLDEVMDELDSLRSGGRAVGIVSHLSELRQRIPTRVHVTADTSGSRIHTA
jgi:exonuclease SbcC